MDPPAQSGEGRLPAFLPVFPGTMTFPSGVRHQPVGLSCPLLHYLRVPSSSGLGSVVRIPIGPTSLRLCINSQLSGSAVEGTSSFCLDGRGPWMRDPAPGLNKINHRSRGRGSNQLTRESERVRRMDRDTQEVGSRRAGLSV